MLQSCRSGYLGCTSHWESFFWLFSLLKDEYHCLDLEVAKRNIVRPDDRTTFATYASSLHRHTSLQEEKDQLMNLFNTIKPGHHFNWH